MSINKKMDKIVILSYYGMLHTGKGIMKGATFINIGKSQNQWWMKKIEVE